jgi:AcrR family transcriptional regulator
MTDLSEHSVPAPGTRALRADAQRNRARILEVARESFAAEGLAVPVDSIAARAGVGVGTLYRHFPTKEALCAAIVASRVEALGDEARALATSADPGAAFFEFLRTMARLSAVDMALADSFADAGYDVKSATVDCKQALIEELDVLLHRGQKSGAVRADMTSQDVLALMAATCIANTRFSTEESSRRILDVVLDGLRAVPAAR